MRHLKTITLAALVAFGLTACGSGATKDEELMAQGGMTAQTTPALAPATTEVTTPEGTITVATPSPDDGVFNSNDLKKITVLGIMDKMSSQGCQFEKVAHTQSIQWEQFVVKCNEPTAIPAVD